MKWYEILGVWGSIASIISIGAIIASVIKFVSLKINRFCWSPQIPLVNENVKHINEHPMDYKLDIINRRISGNANDPSTMATGQEALNMNLIRYVLTEQGTDEIYSRDFGTEEANSIFLIKSKVEFQRQAENLAVNIMNYQKDWILKLYSISRQKDMLIIEYKVKGMPETLKCKIPDIRSKY